MYRPSRLKLTATLSLLFMLIMGLALTGFTRLPLYAAGIPLKLSTTATSMTACGTWKIISSPNAGQGYLNGITALSVDNIWAVGGDGNLSLTEHWDGTSWRVIPSPNVGTNSNALIGVAAISANNVWAVGQSVWSQWPLIEHWDGTSWSINASPSVGTDSNALMVITSVPRTKQLWAVGWYGTGNTTTTLIEHWDGTNWSVVPGPVIGTDSILEGVTALSKNNVWAVGAQNIVGASVGQPLIEHWDGRSWSVSSRPNQESNGFLRAVARVPGASNLWAVGTYSNTNTSYETLTEYWDGENWSIVSSPNHSPESSGNLTLWLKGCGPHDRKSTASSNLAFLLPFHSPPHRLYVY